jgi:hypothetical protein
MVEWVMTAEAQVTAAGAIYKPERLKIMTQAFDAAWAHIEHGIDVRLHCEAYRLKLADAVLAEADGINDPQALTQAALSRLARGDCAGKASKYERAARRHC